MPAKTARPRRRTTECLSHHYKHKASSREATKLRCSIRASNRTPSSVWIPAVERPKCRSLFTIPPRVRPSCQDTLTLRLSDTHDACSARLRIEHELSKKATGLIWFLAPSQVLAQQQHLVMTTQLPAYSFRLITGLDNAEY